VPSDVRVVDVVALLIRLYGSLDPCVFASAERSGLSISRSREDNGNSPSPYGVQRRQRLSLSLSLSTQHPGYATATLAAHCRELP